MGLKSCQVIVQKHHGNLIIEQDEQNFKITIYLPHL
ncbi:MAG: GHKL domain-containing protein [Marvinbryantia sp.]